MTGNLKIFVITSLVKGGKTPSRHYIISLGVPYQIPIPWGWRRLFFCNNTGPLHQQEGGGSFYTMTCAVGGNLFV